MDTDSEKENEASEFPVVEEETPAKFMATQKGRPLLVDPNNYLYNRMKERNGKTYWRCQREVSKICAR
jgi:hypothetical protein